MNSQDYRNKVEGCWLGKAIGGTIGAPYEGKTQLLNPPRQFPTKNCENDDLDLQLAWLDVLKRHGPRITAADLAGEGWSKIVYPFDEYGVAVANVRLGLTPPATGHYNNYFGDCMGSPIRSEIWACIAPGRPGIAAWYAWQDAQVDHYGEGVYGEIYYAALESMAFVETDLRKLIAGALDWITPECRVAQAVRLVLDETLAGKELPAIRESILEKFGHPNFTHCVQNIAFTVLGLLKGNGRLLDSIIEASRCGYDVDCTAATAGAVMGILMGGKAVRTEAAGCIDETIVLGWGVTGIDAPKTIAELTDQTVAIGNQAGNDLPTLAKGFQLPPMPAYKKPMRIPVRVGAEERVFDGITFDLHGLKSPVRLRFQFRNPVARAVKLNPYTTGKLKLRVDGELKAESTACRPLIPAPHRKDWEGNSIPMTPFPLSAGWHTVEIELESAPGRPLDTVWLPTDDKHNWLLDLEYK